MRILSNGLLNLVVPCFCCGEKWRESANTNYGVTQIEADEEKADGRKDEEAAAMSKGKLNSHSSDNEEDETLNGFPETFTIAKLRRYQDKQSNRKKGEMPSNLYGVNQRQADKITVVEQS
nr:hypothetical protein L203_02018 [Cryptococcus depauperatus CBS 7841]